MGVTVTEGTQTVIKTTTDTGAEIQHVRNDGGTIAVISSIPNVNIDSGTQQTLGTVGTVVGIGTISNIVTTSGTTTGIGTLSNVGSVGLVTRIGNIGTIESGTFTTSLTLNTGTITTGSLSNIAMLHGGTVVISGTVPVSGASAGTDVNIVTGTISSLPSLPSGTNIIGDVIITNGTYKALVTNAGNVGVYIGNTNLPNINGGTIGSILGIGGTVQVSGASAGTDVNIVTGTVTTGSLANVAVVNNIVTGTLSSVTISNIYTGSQVLIAQAVGTTGGTIVGTLSAASGAGTYHWVSGLQIVVGAGTTDVFLGFGTTTTGGSVLARGIFTPGGGIMRDLTFPVRSVGTNSEICYIIAGAGTAFIAVNYWKGI